MAEVKIGNKRAYVGNEENPDALMTWSGSDNSSVIVIDHTEVDESLRGQGVGHDLFMATVEYARENDKKISATCPFAVAEIKKHRDEIEDVLNN